MCGDVTGDECVDVTGRSNGSCMCCYKQGDLTGDVCVDVTGRSKGSCVC